MCVKFVDLNASWAQVMQYPDDVSSDHLGDVSGIGKYSKLLAGRGRYITDEAPSRECLTRLYRVCCIFPMVRVSPCYKHRVDVVSRAINHGPRSINRDVDGRVQI